MHRIREKYVLYPILHINPYNLDKRADYYLETTIRIQKTGGMDTKSWESIPPESYVISDETLYLIFDYPYKYYTFKLFEV